MQEKKVKSQAQPQNNGIKFFIKSSPISLTPKYDMIWDNQIPEVITNLLSA